jgi:hypothetical protein
MSSMDVTVVLTSCGRYDLLERTLESFGSFNTYPGIAQIIVVEDGAGDPSEVCKRHGASLVRTGARLGQARCIDIGYQQVSTPFIFHMEDDWEFYKHGFIERSKLFLEQDPSTLLVWLRAWTDTNGHPLSFKARDGSMGVLAAGYDGCWNGFTFNPGLRRKSDYDLIGSFAAHKLANYPWAPGGAHEAAASVFYFQLGFRAVILDEGGYVRHIGWKRQVARHVA